MVVKKIDGKYYVYSEDGSKKLGGPYATRQQATERIGQIEHFKSKESIIWEVVDLDIKEAEGKKGVLKMSGTALKTGMSRNNVKYSYKNIEEADGSEFNFLVGHRKDYDNPDHNVGDGVYHKLENNLKFSGEISNTTSHQDIVEQVKKGRVSVSVQGGYKKVTKKDGVVEVEGLRVPLLCLVNKHTRGVQAASIEAAIEEKLSLDEANDVGLNKRTEAFSMSEEYAMERLKETEEKMRELKESNEAMIKEKEVIEKAKLNAEKTVKEMEEEKTKLAEKTELEEKEKIVEKIVEANKELKEKDLLEKSLSELKIIESYELKEVEDEEGAAEVDDENDKVKEKNPLAGFVVEKDTKFITMSEARRQQFNKEMMESIYR